jgi:hypothetical protein
MIIFSIFTAICNQSCVHGACTQPYVCNCQAGWIGASCDEGKFKLYKITNESYENRFFQLFVSQDVSMAIAQDLTTAGLF